MYFYLSVYVFGVLGFFIHYFYLAPSKRTKARTIELLLLYQIVFSLGITSFLAFIGLSFMPEEIAHYLDWEACPFEQELANVNLAFFILSILAIWYRGLFWVATILGFSIWILADGIHHIIEFAVFKNYSPGNTGMPLYTDFIVPIVLLILLGLYLRTHKGILEVGTPPKKK